MFRFAELLEFAPDVFKMITDMEEFRMNPWDIAILKLKTDKPSMIASLTSIESKVLVDKLSLEKLRYAWREFGPNALEYLMDLMGRQVVDANSILAFLFLSCDIADRCMFVRDIEYLKRACSSGLLRGHADATVVIVKALVERLLALDSLFDSVCISLIKTILVDRLPLHLSTGSLAGILPFDDEFRDILARMAKDPYASPETIQFVLTFAASDRKRMRD